MERIGTIEDGEIFGPDSDTDTNHDEVEEWISSLQNELILAIALFGKNNDYDISDFLNYFEGYGDDEAVETLSGAPSNIEEPIGSVEDNTLAEAPEPIEEQPFAKLSSGQILITYALLLQIIMFLNIAGDMIGVGFLFISLVLSIIGFLRIAAHFNYSIVKRVVFCVAFFLPLLGTVALLLLNYLSAKVLLTAGYKFGPSGFKA